MVRVATRASATLLALISLSSFYGYLGVFEPTARRWVGVLCLAGIPLLIAQPSEMKRREWLGIAGFSLLLLWILHSGSVLFVVPLALAVLAWSGLRPGVLSSLSLAWFAFDVIELARLETEFGRMWTHAAASFSNVVSSGPVLGPTPLALGPLVFAGLLAVCGRRRWWIAAIGIAVLPGIAWLHVGLQEVWVVLFAVGIPLGLTLRDDQPASSRWAPLTAAALLGVMLVAWVPIGEHRQGEILVVRPGLYYLDKPKPDTRLKDVIGPSLPCLMDTLQSFGHTTRTIDKEILDSDLARVQTVVLVNTTRVLPPGEIDRLYRFMEEGGSVLVIGEHTNVSGVMDRLNPLTSRAGIKLNFDTTWPWQQPYMWGFYLDWVRNPILRRVKGEDDIQAGVGCSLSLSSPATPLLIGRAGFGDIGDPANEEMAYLGDKVLNKKERSGDLVLAAVSHVGRGKMVVFGDSLTFQDAYVPRTYPFILSLFQYLARAESAPSTPLRAVGWIILAAAAIGSMFLRQPLWGALAAFASLTIVDAVSPKLPMPEFKPSLPVAWIDFSHRPLALGPQADGPNSTDGLVFGLYQNGFLPLFLNDFDDPRLFQSKLLLAPASARPWTISEIRRLDQYLEGGRTAIATVGFPERHAMHSLMERHGMSLTEKPLGNGGPNRKTYAPGVSIRFYSAWPVELKRPSAQPVALSDKIPVAAAARVGKGMFLLIGDSYFFALKNWDGYRDGPDENSGFFRHLLQTVKNP